MGYFIIAAGSIQPVVLMLLLCGGFLVTGAANAFNQVLEKDLDKLMVRTMNRPLAGGRMSVSEAVLFAGFSSVTGILLLALIHPLAALLGSVSLLSYSFIYTPLKRTGSIAVYVGAIPGALPVLIGAAAAEGTISMLALVLFGIQFIWQFPHFWSIAWVSHEDYSRAGFKLLPSASEEPRNKMSAGFTLASSGLLTAFPLMALVLGYLQFWPAVLSAIAGAVLLQWSFGLFSKLDKRSAMKIMFGSFVYLPLVLLFIWVFSN